MLRHTRGWASGTFVENERVLGRERAQARQDLGDRDGFGAIEAALARDELLGLCLCALLELRAARLDFARVEERGTLG